MRTLQLLAVALLTANLGRGVRVAEPTPAVMPSAFDARQSAALFVGVREFPHDPALGEVRYAADDAINMAWLFSMDPRVRLVTPERVVLALAGEPQKEESERQRRQLVAAGARIEHADRATIESLLQRQADSVGSGGVFIVSFATHGFSSDGASYVLGTSSVYDRLETSIPTGRILDVAARAPRSLLFFDACRERKGSRAAPLPPPFVEALTETGGQVVFTPSGEYTWENPAARNGAFTAAIVAGLQCKAKRDHRGFVTVDTLGDYAEKRLRDWVRQNRDPYARHAIRVIADGDSGNMPLASCSLPPPPPPSPARVAYERGSLAAFDGKGHGLWHIPVSGTIATATVADLDGDGSNEVVILLDGTLAVFRPNGELWWTKDTSAPDNYDTTGSPRISKFVVGPLYRKDRQQIVALSVDSRGAPSSRVVVFDGDGSVIGAYFHPGRLLDAAIARPTSHHKHKIVVTAENVALQDTVTLCRPCSSVFVLDPRRVEGEAPPYRGKLGFGTQLWYGYLQHSAIDRLEIVDCDRDGKRDISLALSNGRLSVDFDGRIIEAKNASFGLVK